jgi:hypothetical protein
MRISISLFPLPTVVGALLALCVVLLAPCVAAQNPDTQKPLTNADIVALVKAGVSEAAIVATISNSRRAFQTTPAALIELKQAGVSDRIIEAIVLDTAPLAPSPATPGSDTTSLPSAFGYYIFANRLLELRASSVVTKFGLTLGDRGMAVDGLPTNPCLTIDSRTPTLIVHQQSVNITNLRLSFLSFVESMQAHQFNILNTSPQFFSGLYKKNPTDTVPIDLWRPSRHIDVRVEPVTGRLGMYRLTPSVPLQPGRYAFYAAESLHGGDIVFTASQDRQAEAFEFEIVGTPISSAAASALTVAYPMKFPVVHRHNFGRCSGTLEVSKETLKYQQEGSSGKHSFELPITQVSGVSQWSNNYLEIVLKDGRKLHFAHGVLSNRTGLRLEDIMDLLPIEPMIEAIRGAIR